MSQIPTMRVELVGGPKDGDFMEVVDGTWEYYIVKPPNNMHNFVAFKKESADIYPILVRGIYKRKFGTKDYYWQGWEDDTTE